MSRISILLFFSSVGAPEWTPQHYTGYLHLLLTYTVGCILYWRVHLQKQIYPFLFDQIKQISIKLHCKTEQ